MGSRVSAWLPVQRRRPGPRPRPRSARGRAERPAVAESRARASRRSEHSFAPRLRAEASIPRLAQPLRRGWIHPPVHTSASSGSTRQRPVPEHHEFSGSPAAASVPASASPASRAPSCGPVARATSKSPGSRGWSAGPGAHGAEFSARSTDQLQRGPELTTVTAATFRQKALAPVQHSPRAQASRAKSLTTRCHGRQAKRAVTRGRKKARPTALRRRGDRSRDSSPARPPSHASFRDHHYPARPPVRRPSENSLATRTGRRIKEGAEPPRPPVRAWSRAAATASCVGGAL